MGPDGSNDCTNTKRTIDGFALEGALWVIRARFQGNKAAKCTFFFIFPFRVSLSRRNFYCKRGNPFSVFTSVSESIELGIRLLTRVTEMLFLWLWLNHLVLTVKKFVRPQHSLDRLKNVGKPWKEVTPHTACVSLPNLKSERKYEEKRTFCCLVSLKSCPDYP